MSWQIAIDGPAGAGKSTIAKEVAKILEFEYVDTGSMYRAVTLKAMKLGINMEDEKEYSFLEDTKFDFINHKIYLDNVDVSNDIRTLAVSNKVSLVSKFKYVRSFLVKLQRKLADDKNVIMDGRDIGSVVLPNAFLKIYLNATVEERAKRRMEERALNNNNNLSYLETIEEIKARDYKDSNRKVSPLIKTSDAIEIDSSKLSVRTVVETIISLVCERGYRMENLEKKSEAVVEETMVEEAKQEELVVEEKKEAKKTASKKTPKAKKEEAVEEAVEKEEELVVEEKKETKKAVSKKTPNTNESEEVEKTEAEDVKQEELVVEEKNSTLVKDEVEKTEENDVDDSEESDDVEAQEVDEDEEDEEETVEEPEEKKIRYKQLQLVKGEVVDVEPGRPSYTDESGRTYRGREERVLIRLEDGQEGYLLKRDCAQLEEKDELFDVFLPGDIIEVIIKKIYPDGGKFLFSTKLLAMREDLKQFENSVKNHEILSAKVTKVIPANKDKNRPSPGLLLRYNGYSCLLPSSQINATDEEKEKLIGEEILVTPIRVDFGRIRLIVSNTVALAIERRLEKEKLIEEIEVGAVYDGVVKNIESYGAFVELVPGIEGLLHISEIDHSRVYKIEKYAKVGDTIKVKVINIEKKEHNTHIGLSRKALLPNYFTMFTEGKVVGDVTEVKAIEINNSGVVVQLNEGLTGFLPKSEFSWERGAFIEDVISVGDMFEAKIIEIDPSKKRIIFSRKQLISNPWESLNIQVGDKIKVEVKYALSNGFKVSYNEAIGYMPIKSIRSVSPDTIKLGDIIDVSVGAVDSKATRLIVYYDTFEARPREMPVREKGPAPRKNNRIDTNQNKYTIESQDQVSNTFGDFLDQFKDSKKK